MRKSEKRTNENCMIQGLDVFGPNFQFLIGPSLLCESAVLVKGKSFVILYTYFSFKHLMENPLAKEFSLLLKGKSFTD